MKILKFALLLLFFISSQRCVFAQTLPDQQFVIRGIDELSLYEESSENILYNTGTNSIELKTGEKKGFYISKTITFSEKFNRGLPSWNGHAPENSKSSFKISMRFKMSYGWSKWITVGYWDNYIWSTYGDTRFNGGKVAIDYVKLDEFISEYKFKIEFKREKTDIESSSLKQFAFFVSDSRTTQYVNIDKLAKDNPPAIFIPTGFVYQYGVDPIIGGKICSPSTLSMIIKSFGYEVDPYDFALRTKDPYWDLFGVWPRGVQSASEYGLSGSVTRYRSWTDAYKVLKEGGRIAITVGPPLFNAHLMMLAGFDENGNPLFHNPGNSNGYGISYDKRKITESWFNKGGISYTFYDENAPLAYDDIIDDKNDIIIYPNPVKDRLNIEYDAIDKKEVKVKIYNTLGYEIYEKYFDKPESKIQIQFNHQIPPGVYILNLYTKDNIRSKLFIKK